MRTITALFFVIVCALAMISVVRVRTFNNPYQRICDLVENKIYLEDKELNEWVFQCRKRASLVTPGTPMPVIVRDARALMDILRVSHLNLYHPDEVARAWNGEDRQTGIESEYVDGELVIFRVEPGSPADKQGVKSGDLIRAVQGEHPAPELVKAIGGLLRLSRGGKEFEKEVWPERLHLDESPKISKADEQTIWLRVPSFRAEFFAGDNWRRITAELTKAKRVLVDLRGNSGGNFVAGLRFLSPFMCGEQDIGYLYKPKSGKNHQEFLPDELSDEAQLDVIDRADMVAMKTYSNYGCITGRVTVFIDSRTASTAEMVTQALKDYVDAQVLGISSSGQLLVGVWYDLPELGPGWKISVPEAVYQTRRGRRLEGGGVRVDRTLYYDLKDLQAGRDSWVEKSLLDFRRDSKHTDSRPPVSK